MHLPLTDSLDPVLGARIERGAAWTLHYVKSPYGVTDAPDQVRRLEPRVHYGNELPLLDS